MCSLNNGFKRNQLKAGNDNFHWHVESDCKVAKCTSESFFTITSGQKKIISEAVAKLILQDSLPLGFCNEKTGILYFATALIELGQRYTSSVYIDVHKLLPCRDTVGSSVIQLIKNIETEIGIIEHSSILMTDGAVTCDGVKLEATGKGYYDFVLNYLKYSRRKISYGGGYEWELRFQVLFIAPT